jgi:hypothetical protein
MSIVPKSKTVRKRLALALRDVQILRRLLRICIRAEKDCIQNRHQQSGKELNKGGRAGT